MPKKILVDPNEPINELRWVRHSRINVCRLSHIGGQLLVFGHGSAITICRLDDPQSPDGLYRAVRPTSDGVACVAGHPQLSLFAYAEQAYDSRIFIVEWPEARVLATLCRPNDGVVQATGPARNSRRILALAFSDTEHLAVLTGYPHFTLEVWNWRTQRRMGEQATEVFSDLQYIAWSSMSTPHCIVQCAYSLGVTLLWEVHLSADTYAFIRRSVPRHCVGDMQPPYAVCQLPDAGIYMTNASNSVWQACLATQCADLIIQGVPSADSTLAAVNQTESALATATTPTLGSTATATQQTTTHGSTAMSLLESSGGSGGGLKESSRALLSRMSREELFESGDDSTGLLNLIRPLDPERIVFLFAYRGGLALIQMDGVVRVYRRLTAAQTESGNAGWAELFSMPTLGGGETVLAYVCVSMRELVVYTTGGKILRLQDNDADATPQREWRLLRNYDRHFVHCVLVQPLGDLLVTVNEAHQVRLVRVTTGQLLDELLVKRSCTWGVGALAAYPSVPAVAVGSLGGCVHIASVYGGQRFAELVVVNLTAHPIEEICVCPSSARLVVRDAAASLFVLSGQLGHQINVTLHIELDARVLNVAPVWQSAAEFTLAVLLVPHVAPGKQRSDRCQLIRVQRARSYALVECTLPKEYVSLEWTGHGSLQFVAVPSLSNYFECIDVLPPADEPRGERGNSVDPDEDDGEQEPLVQVRLARQTMHRVCSVQVAVVGRDRRQLADATTTPPPLTMITWSPDGAVQLWQMDDWTPLAAVWTLNHLACGIRLAMMDSFGVHVVVVGTEGNMQCIQWQLLRDAKLHAQVREELKGATVVRMFENPTKGLGHEMNWLQAQRKQRAAIEQQKYAAERSAIQVALAGMGQKVAQLIDENEVAPADEQLPIVAFELDEAGSQRKRDAAAEQCKADHEAITSESGSLVELANTIHAHTWNKMQTKGRQVRGIFTRQKVENYALLNTDDAELLALRRYQHWRSIEQPLAEADGFRPWRPYTDEELRQFDGTDGVQHMLETLEKPLERREPAPSKRYTLSGTSSHRYIEPSPMRYHQLDVVTYYQMATELLFGRFDALKMREKYNKRFVKLADTKADELFVVWERHRRVRFIHSELNILERLRSSDVRHDRLVEDPVQTFDEQPERVMRVAADELSVTPYVSPEEQANIDARAAEAERRRLERLADDFRERALMKMMNGVLEVLWWEEIKKQPPLAECVRIGKDPKDYTPEDLRAIADYDEEVIRLEGERTRYFGILKAEEAQLGEQLYNQLHQFNRYVAEELMEKIKVEFAISSEDLKMLRMVHFNWERQQLAGEEEKLEIEMALLRHDITSLTTRGQMLSESLATVLAAFEEMKTKDNLLDRHFKIGFADFASKALTDQAHRIFRRRPKWQPRAWQTPAIMNDMAWRCVHPADSPAGAGGGDGPASATSRPLPLPDECTNYLRLIDVADRANQTTPNQLDAAQWRALCRMRRVKLEHEFRVRACGAQVADTEAAVKTFQREIVQRREQLAQLEHRQAELVAVRERQIVDRNVQLCVKRGCVEIPLTGHRSDFACAVLLHQSDVISINAVIKRAGERKLAAMRQAALFRRKIIAKEWEHRCLRLQIAEKRADIRNVQRCQVTKEVQRWLRFRRENWPDDMTDNKLHNQSEATRLKMESLCNAIVRQVNETRGTEALKRQELRRLDRRIEAVNLFVAEKQIERAAELTQPGVQQRQLRFTIMLRRARTVREIQRNHVRILQLCGEMERLRERTFPTLRTAGARAHGEIEDRAHC